MRLETMKNQIAEARIPSNLELVWSDEFGHEGLPNSEKWGYEEGFVRNAEEQYYTKGRMENARVENGVLVIEGRKEEYLNSAYEAGSEDWRRSKEFADYTSAALVTKNKASWTYGRFEIRAKLPSGGGVWPAIWMLGENISIPETPWPICGEIDIMEFVGKDPGYVHGNIHYGPDGVHKCAPGKMATENPWDDFHVYAIDWDERVIDFYFDDIKYHSVYLDVAGKGADNAFRKPQYLLINLALGGGWGGRIDTSIFPQKFLIDYVRVYQKA